MTQENDIIKGTPENPSDAIITLPNAVSFVRLCMIPAFFVMLMQGNNIAATALFAIAACTDFLDGQIARRTNRVTKLGRMLDPAVDRLLMILGVLGVYLTGRIPLWIIALVLGRDIVLMAGYAILLKRWKVRVDVIYPGKVATTFFFIGFAGLVLNAPLIPGLGWCDIAWLPGFNGTSVCWAIWFIYAGLLLGAYSTTYYVREALRKLSAARKAERS
ncbi:CDP-alcohol phosphatidyltransferase [Denitrobacterium detoxificans]|uniref:CDP-diacylglycerol--glycerol-3-phosphate 3-phosphatidyltransferase n=1 Tax=Denitrobacterium detoxificans TaxID=79604 RepID=A0A172RYC8_9ACTN|nr:CDP-alcohol phosphatidyltransferase family protein [Denitrobacterium detoxificans]ANE22684.1 CDP-alcohol phosphatidyltransferase [Denitrobacterium detoxificans]SEO87115.1 CDP-diacylglycerol--glycerol-3-phosphate 3-phosphatidyltransferase [Denitrobacterium detoxificans]